MFKFPIIISRGCIKNQYFVGTASNHVRTLERNKRIPVHEGIYEVILDCLSSQAFSFVVFGRNWQPNLNSLKIQFLFIDNCLGMYAEIAMKVFPQVGSMLISPIYFRVVYHCPFCNLCRVGRGLGVDFFHCMTCNCCLAKKLVDHKCREKGLETNCPICCDFLFTSSATVRALPCGHFMHSDCFQVCSVLCFVFFFGCLWP